MNLGRIFATTQIILTYTMRLTKIGLLLLWFQWGDVCRHKMTVLRRIRSSEGLVGRHFTAKQSTNFQHPIEMLLTNFQPLDLACYWSFQYHEVLKIATLVEKHVGITYKQIVVALKVMHRVFLLPNVLRKKTLNITRAWLFLHCR